MKFRTKLQRVMKLTTALLLTTALHLSARTLSQTVSYSAKNVRLEKVFTVIKQQTNFVFFYKLPDIKDAKPVTVDFTNTPLKDALEKILQNQPLNYSIQGNTIFITPKPQPLPPGGGTILLADSLRNVRGVVKDESGKPVADVSVKVKGTNKGTTTDDNGDFFLKGVDDKKTLVFSSVNMETFEIAVNGKNDFSVSLKTKTTALEDVAIQVNTGYKKIKAYQSTGSASVMSEKEYDQRVAVTGNFLESLEGKIPGLVYNQQTGELSIRGISTFNAVNQPLIVVDGFPTNIDLNTINPNDIISVTVLKDAAAAAIYGVRASNGVIIIETRRGKSGKTMVNVRSTTAFQTKPDFGYLKYAPASEYAKLESDAITAAGNIAMINLFGTLLGSPFSPVQQVRVNQYLGTITADQASQQVAAIGSYDNLNDYKNLFYQNHLTSNVNVDVSGGSQKNTYLLGLNYIGDKLSQQRADNQLYRVSLANTFELNKAMKFDFKSIYSNSVNKSGNVSPYNNFFPYERLVDGNGNALPVAFGNILSGGANSTINAITAAKNNAGMALGLYDKLYYPYRELTANTNTTKVSSFQFEGRLNTRINNWLSFDLGGNYQNQNRTVDNLMGEQAFNTRLLLDISATKDPTTGRAVYNTIPQGDILKRNIIKTVGYTVRAQLNVNKNFHNNEHQLLAILGLEQRKTTTESNLATYFGYDGQTLLSKPYNLVALNSLGSSNAAFPTLGSILADGRTSTSYFGLTYQDTRFMSYYGDATYIYKGKYIATGSLRLDQSNLFGSDPKYRSHPLSSVGLAWRMDQEDFIRPVKWVSELKLRVATGFTGNIPATNNGKYLLLSSAINTNLPTALAYYTVSNPQNTSLRWETTKNYNVGLDYSLFNGRLAGTADYYIKNSVDLYGNFDADPTTGFNSYNANTASMTNKGFEFSANTINIKTRNFSWRTGVTASFNHNEVTAIKATSFSGSTNYVTGTQLIVGQPMKALYSYNYGGLTNLGQPSVVANSSSKILLNGSTIDVAQSDLIYNGTVTPKYALGLNNQFTIGAFDVSFMFMYYGGHVMRVQPPIAGSVSEQIPLQGASNYWKSPGDEAATLIPRLPLGSSAAVGYYNGFATYGYMYASQFTRKADYIKLRDFIITYNVKWKALTKIGVEQPQIRFQAQNAFRYTFSGNDIDPEAINPVTGVRNLPIQPFYSFSLYCKF